MFCSHAVQMKQVVHIPTTSAAEEFAAGSKDNLHVHSVIVTTSNM
jgi:hypothetical protein